MERLSNIKIFISYHKPARIISSKTMIPIQVGAKLSEIDLGIQRDDDGDNISEKNDRFCELTAQYWAWKNIKADYYGFMHYRRHLVFGDIEEMPDDGGQIFMSKINDEYIKKIALNDDSVYDQVEGYDLVLTPEVNVSGWCAPSNEIQFSCLNNLHARDFDMVCELVKEMYPDYSDTVERFRKGSNVYWYNIFVMRKVLFDDYCKWLFSILESAEMKVDYSNYDSAEKRTLAFMAERLFTIYVNKLLETNPDIKIKYLKMTFVENTDVDESNIIRKKQEVYEGDFKRIVEPLKRSYKELCSIGKTSLIEEKTLLEACSLIDQLENRNICFYGAGNYCRRILEWFDDMGIKKPILIWDKRGAQMDSINGIPIEEPDFDSERYKNCLWVITLANADVAESVRNLFEKNDYSCVVKKNEIMSALVCEMWRRLNAGEI